MCRILFLWNTSNQTQKIHAFLEQSIHTEKYTPGIKSVDHSTHTDGFGLAWLTNKWKTYKKPFVYNEDKNLGKKISQIESESSIILGHVRHKTFGDKDVDNTHPFVYQDFIFLHNGSLKNFEKHKKTIISRIAPEYIKKIKGETDSEHLFYLLLTIKDGIIREDCTTLSEEKILYNSLYKLFSLLNEWKIEYYANIIFGNTTHLLISRYVQKQSQKEGQPLSLYYDKSNGIVVSSEPISGDYKIVPKNSIIIVRLDQ